MKNRIGNLTGFMMFLVLGIMSAKDVINMVQCEGSLKDIYESYLLVVYLVALPIGAFIFAIIWLIKAILNKE